MCTKQKLPVCMSVKCWQWHLHGRLMEQMHNKEEIKALSTAHQWTSGRATNIIYHNGELFGQATSLWESWCNAQTKMRPGDRVARLDRHTKPNKDPSKIIPF